jgi:PadR family transcriptional regulator PadR
MYNSLLMTTPKTKTTPFLTLQKTVQMRRGLLEFATLIIIGSAKPSFSIKEISETLAKTEFITKEESLYILLSRLRREGLVISGFEQSDIGKARKYYDLTDKGKYHLHELEKYWETLGKTLTSFKETDLNKLIFGL